MEHPIRFSETEKGCDAITVCDFVYDTGPTASMRWKSSLHWKL